MLCQGVVHLQLLRAVGQQGAGAAAAAYQVNLIPVNPIEERSYESPDRASIAEFVRILKINGINVTVRREMGRDISSACGQLRRRYIKDADTGIN